MYVCFTNCSKITPWLYSYKVDPPRPEFISTPSGLSHKHVGRSLSGDEVLRRRHAYSYHISMNPPQEILPYRTALLPPASRYSRPGAMDPQIKYNRRMEYSANVAEAHADSLVVTERGHYHSHKMKTESPRIDPRSALSKRLAYDKSKAKNSQHKINDTCHEDKTKNHCCSDCLVKVDPPVRYSAQGSMIGHAHLKASWSRNTKSRVFAFPDVTVRGYSCSGAHERATHNCSCLPKAHGSRNSGYRYKASYQTTISNSYRSNQFTPNMTEVLKHIRVYTRNQPHLVTHSPVLRVSGLCPDKDPPPNTPRCADDLYNTLICTATLGDRYGNKRTIPYCNVSILKLNDCKDTEMHQEMIDNGQADSQEPLKEVNPFSLSYRPFF